MFKLGWAAQKVDYFEKSPAPHNYFGAWLHKALEQLEVEDEPQAVHLMVQILKPNEGMSIHDPTVGFASINSTQVKAFRLKIPLDVRDFQAMRMKP